MSDIVLNTVFPSKYSLSLLYKLLQERTPEQSISHREMPSYMEHCAFVRSMPYIAWLWIEVDLQPIGAVYLSKNREIGISVFKAHQGKGYGRAAIRLLMDMFPGEFFANINQHNEGSAKLFKSFGFKLIQHTYRLDAPHE